MAHSLPAGGIGTAADAERLTLAAITFTNMLMKDARVSAHYRSWLHTRGLDVQIARLRQQPTAAEVEAFGDALVADQRGDVESIATLVLHELGVAYDWVPVLLLVAYRTLAYNEARGDDEHVVVTLGVRTALPQGRRARHRGADIARNVEWYYLARIRSPRVDITELAADYAAGVGRDNDARSVVQNGIKQAAVLFDLVVAHVHDE